MPGACCARGEFNELGECVLGQGNAADNGAADSCGGNDGGISVAPFALHAGLSITYC